MKISEWKVKPTSPKDIFSNFLLSTPFWIETGDQFLAIQADYRLKCDVLIMIPCQIWWHLPDLSWPRKPKVKTIDETQM